MKLSMGKGRLIGAIRKVNIQTRLLAALLSVSLIPVVLVGMYAYNTYTASINSKLSESSGQAVSLLNTTIATELERYAFYINSLSISDTVQDILAAPASSERMLDEREVAAIQRLINQASIQVSYLKDIQIVDREGHVLFALGYDDVAPPSLRNLLDKTDGTSPSDSLSYVRTYRGSDALVLGRKIYRFASGTEHIGYIFVFIHEKLLHDKFYRDITFGADGNILLMEEDGSVLSSRDQSLSGTNISGTELYDGLMRASQSGKTSYDVNLDGKAFLVVFSHSTKYDNYFIATIPHAYIAGETRSINQNLLLVAGVLILISLVAAFVIYLSIMQPIRRIVARCNVAAEDGHEINDASPDELGFLARTVEGMIAQLKEMGHRWQSDQKRKRELELAMLQYQINPHFLFNTLNTLKWVAVMNEVPVLSDGIASLSALLKSTLIHKEELITIREEIENLKHYFAIQRIRYADRFDVQYDVDEALADCHIPRFILQPLAENAVIHGTDEHRCSVLIRVGCRRMEGGEALLEIADDGAGFDTAQLTRKSGDHFSGIGLPNVDERLRLYFGERYGVQIESAPSTGTTCRIVIPRHWLEKEGARDV